MSVTQVQTLQELRTKEYLNNDMLFKMLIIGDAGVGKSCLLLRYADDEFSECYISTIGVDFKIRTVEMDGKVIKLNMWDTAGQERFKTITSTFYRGGHGVMIVFDLTDMESFTNIRKWVMEIDKYGGGHVAKLLVGNKSDIKNKRIISYETAQALADELGMSYLETSAKTSKNVEQAFMTMTACMKQKVDEGVFGDRIKTVPISQGHDVQGKTGWCNC